MKYQDKHFEIEFFNKLAEEGRFNLDLGPFLETFKGAILCHCPEILKLKSNVLEIGCGTGAMGQYLLSLSPPWHITGIDISPKMIEILNGLSIENYTTKVGDANETNLFKKGEFDIILCPFILHHMLNIQKIISNIALWLKKDGYLLIVDLNASNPVNKFFKWVRYCFEFFYGKEYIMRKGWATPNETNHSIKTVRRILNKYRIQDIFHIQTTAFYRKSSASKFHWMLQIRNALLKISSILPGYRKGIFVIIFAKNRAQF